MTPDPFLNSGRPANPQTWNRYSYALNNPVTIVDPTGLYNVIDHCAGDKKCEKKLSQAAEALRKSVDKLTDKVSKMKDGEQKTRLQNSLKALENPGTDGTFSGIVSIVARLARVVVAEVAHHVTQRGNARQFLLASDAERFAYLDLLREAVRVEGEIRGQTGRFLVLSRSWLD